mgnify:FL=1
MLINFTRGTMKTNIKTGLSSKEVINRRNKYGSNKLTSKSKNSFIKLVFESLSDPIIKILLIALAIKVIFLFKDSDIYETVGIFIAIFLATIISTLSEYGSEKAFEKLNEENSIIKVKVLRNSKKETINIDELVVGDIVYLESGDKVPADSIIIKGELYIDESILTGETKERYAIINDNIYMGSIVTDKTATIEVTNVGDKTFYGKIANDIQEKSVESPLKSRLRVLAGQISKLGYTAAFLILISYMFNAVVVSNNFNLTKILEFKDFSSHLLYALTLSVAVVVMAVPEGLPMMITLVLSSNMKRLLKRNVLVRKLVGIETAGSLNILFTDKTGTLTEGKLSVELFTDAELIEYKNINKLSTIKYELLYQSLVYNNSSFLNNGVPEGGNTTDRALLSYVGRDDKTEYKIINKEEFNSKLKYSTVETNYKGNTIFIKGAYEKILEKCTKYQKNDGTVRVLINKEKLTNYVNAKTNEGIRALALAYKEKNSDSYILLGFIFLKDNIRKEAYEGIKKIKNAGVQVVMVTGDAKNTAVSIAKELKIITKSTDKVLTSDEFNNMSDEEIKGILPNLRVLSRSLPQDKNRLVKLAQELNLIVGMTGDGINDAPALKRADVGFSMGSGTEIAKETSDIVIIDNNILSISVAILYGRTIFKSIRKFIIFQLSVNICAVLLSIIGPFIGILSPITIIQMLWINMVMDTLAGLAFSYEPALDEYMEEPPKKRNEKIINKYMTNQITLNGIYSTMICIWFLKSKFISSIYRIDPSNKYLLTAFFGLFIFIAIFNSFNARTYRLNILSNILKNKVFIAIIAFIAIVQIILIYYGGEVFRTTGLTIYEFEIMIILAFSIIPFDIIRKIILKKNKITRNI